MPEQGEKGLGRRDLLRGALASGALASTSGIARSAWAAPGFDLGRLSRQAEALASRPPREDPPTLPPALANLNYGDYRRINHRADHALWRGACRFELQFFHPGFIHNRAIDVNLLEADRVREVPFRRHWFDYRGLSLPFEEREAGFSGFRVHYPLHRESYFDEVAVFQGASYFRLLGRDQWFGGSCRAVTVGTIRPGEEEFPRFTRFWVRRPEPSARRLRIWALLEGESLTGAYQFDLEPGEATTVDVRAVLYPRRLISDLGIAPLTSMFLRAADRAGGLAFHDSEGLSLHTGGGEWIWRPLRNPGNFSVSGFMDRSIRGFGLMQRNRDATHFDRPAWHLESRPSLWIEPLEDWGAGRVELVEIPSRDSDMDNVVAYWRSAQPAEPGRPIRLSYRVSADRESVGRPPGGHVAGTEVMPTPDGSGQRFSILFEGGRVTEMHRGAELRAVVSATAGQLSHIRVAPAPTGCRAEFSFRPNADRRPADLRCYLRRGDDALSETWTHPWTS